MTLEDFLGRLDGLTGAFTGNVAQCPAHDDKRASLSITGSDDRILIYCHAGCTAEEIVDAMGLEMKDLFYDGRTIGPEQPEAYYDYHDEEGKFLYRVWRFPGKRFKQSHVKDGQWVWNMNGVRKVPYRLPWLLQTEKGFDDAYVVEGEKDADALNALDRHATTFPGGAKKFLPTYVKFFKDLDVVIVRDKDEAGRQNAELIKESLEGVARSVKVVEALEGKDVSDHLRAGYSVNQLVSV